MCKSHQKAITIAMLSACLFWTRSAHALNTFSFEVGLGAVSLPGIELTHQLRAAYEIPLDFYSSSSIDLLLEATTKPLFLGLNQLFVAGRYNFGYPFGLQPFSNGGTWLDATTAW